MWRYPGLCELIVKEKTDAKIYTDEDYDNYIDIMHKTNALYRNNNENETNLNSSKSWKWKNILKQIWGKKILLEAMV